MSESLLEMGGKRWREKIVFGAIRTQSNTATKCPNNNYWQSNIKVKQRTNQKIINKLTAKL